MAVALNPTVSAAEITSSIGEGERSGQLSPVVVALGVCVLGMIVAPWICYVQDFRLYWLPWARETRGVWPWGVYHLESDYPPLLPYWLTVIERVRLWINGGDIERVMVALIKLPNVLAHAAGGIVCWVGLRGIIGSTKARLAAILYLVSPAMFVDAAGWGQHEAMLTLAMLGAMVLALHGRPVWAGVILGVGLSLKLQAIVAAPLLGIYVLRRFGWRTAVMSALCGLGVIAVVALPHVISGQGRGVLRAYAGAVGHYPQTTISAYNTWYVFEGAAEVLPGGGVRANHPDTTAVIGPMTLRQLGLLAFAAYTLAAVIGLWRRVSAERFLLANVLLGFAFFMLPTQIHERYLVPAAALAAVVAVQTRWCFALYAWLNIGAAMNQLIMIYRVRPEVTLSSSMNHLTLAVGGVIAVINVGLFCWVTWKYFGTERRDTTR